MISGWLIKVLVGIALIGFLIIELGSPLIARAQADDAAHEVANEVAFSLKSDFRQTTLDSTCADQAKQHNVTADCTYDRGRNVVDVKVTKQAKSFLFVKINALKGWYNVKASASASPK